MEFLLECIGFPPGQDQGELIERVRRDGEPVPWRGDPENHLRLPIGGKDALREIVVGAECLWCQDANESGAFWSGFQLIDISPEHQDILNSVVGE